VALGGTKVRVRRLWVRCCGPHAKVGLATNAHLDFTCSGLFLAHTAVTFLSECNELVSLLCYLSKTHSGPRRTHRGRERNPSRKQL